MDYLTNYDNINSYDDSFKVLAYLTLLSLNNHNYKEDIYLEEINKVENFLRKVNNYKVKIQLKRKEGEINTLLTEIKDIYNRNTDIINKYNKDNLDIINILDSREPKEITPLIDRLTRVKMKKVNILPKYNNIINTNIDNYEIENNTININNNLIISFDGFYDIYDYLLDLSNYKEVYRKTEIINYHHKLILDYINMIKSNTKLTKEETILVILNYLVKKDIIPNELDFSKFKIGNIKISDLYNFANNNLTEEYHAKWGKVIIPNDYLFNKIKELLSMGMCYFKDDSFILENTSDFKISISSLELINLINKMN